MSNLPFTTRPHNEQVNYVNKRIMEMIQSNIQISKNRLESEITELDKRSVQKNNEFEELSAQIVKSIESNLISFEIINILPSDSVIVGRIRLHLLANLNDFNKYYTKIFYDISELKLLVDNMFSFFPILNQKNTSNIKKIFLQAVKEFNKFILTYFNGTPINIQHSRIDGVATNSSPLFYKTKSVQLYNKINEVYSASA
jgi:hypothetical protein